MTDRLGTTPSQTVGPFLSIGLDWPDGADVVAEGTPGAVTIRGTVTDGDGAPVGDALVEIWHAGSDGRFDPAAPCFGRCATDADGGFAFLTRKPGRVDGEQAPHVDVLVFARGLLRHLVTRMYFPDEAAANERDPVLRGLPADERALLVAAPEPGPVLRFDVRLQGEGETPFFVL